MTYNPKIVYSGTDVVTRQNKTIEVDFPAIKIIGLVKITEKPQVQGGEKVSFDASDIKAQGLGLVNWFFEGSADPDSKDYQFYPDKIFKTESLVCLTIVNNVTNPNNNCSRIFIINPDKEAPISGKIFVEQDPDNPMSYTFSLGEPGKDLKSRGDITSYEWMIDDKNVVSSTDTAQRTFDKPGKHIINVNLVDTNGDKATLTYNLDVRKPLKVAVNASTHLSALKATDKKTGLTIPLTYDQDRNMYVLPPTISAPEMLNFDVRDVLASDPTYRLRSASWNFKVDQIDTGTGTKTSTSDASTTPGFDTKGLMTSTEILDPTRYLFAVRYEFVSIKDATDIQYLTETIVLDSRQQDMIPNMKVTQDSDYAPAHIHIDASASSTTSGKIAKFMFDFGESKYKEVEGDAIQDHLYAFPGEYTITLVVEKDDGETAKTTKKIILKEPERRVVINSSVASGYTGKPVDFDAAGTAGQITSYLWDFGDGT